MKLIHGRLYRTRVPLYWTLPNVEIKVRYIILRDTIVLYIRDTPESIIVILNDGIVEVPMGPSYSKNHEKPELIAAQFFEEVETQEEEGS